ncbi:hypothetical protein D0469_11370 [Peribacillus saganii]|uniref:PepSY domain-containing protein n=1 Tax=Peribacillus saganii TaxID=2303992 RepID=A0A372LMX4_9BACI|nr:PepSY domain-containing protein [Peribacillus saganii]RFU68730.1 hypothetical protein D0469_11370 [Peribacillus saganii]
MNWKTFLAGATAGIAAGYVAKQVMDQTVNITPESILSNVKNSLRKDGKINGSWIIMKPEPYQKFNLDYNVYKGGITRIINGNPEQYEFVADATTGTLLDLNVVSN